MCFAVIDAFVFCINITITNGCLLFFFRMLLHFIISCDENCMDSFHQTYLHKFGLWREQLPTVLHQVYINFPINAYCCIYSLERFVISVVFQFLTVLFYKQR